LQDREGVRILPAHPDEKIALADRLATIAERYGIRMYSCCGEHLVNDRIHKAHCIDGGIIERLFAPGYPYQEKPTRKECGCTESIDIGAYDTCPHGCVYCYANANKTVAGEAFRRHDADSAFLGVDKSQSEPWLAEIRRRDSDESTITPTLL
jgi:hypothetical protein